MASELESILQQSDRTLSEWTINSKSVATALVIIALLFIQAMSLILFVIRTTPRLYLHLSAR
jgi:succinate dehydrogenase flavin-adding protein (antitoxin of CptAB toxin-antitoxin module)